MHRHATVSGNPLFQRFQWSIDVGFLLCFPQARWSSFALSFFIYGGSYLRYERVDKAPRARLPFFPRKPDPSETIWCFSYAFKTLVRVPSARIVILLPYPPGRRCAVLRFFIMKVNPPPGHDSSVLKVSPDNGSLFPAALPSDSIGRRDSHPTG